MISNTTNTLIFEKSGIVWGKTQSGKTWRVSEFLSECPHYCFFINTQLEQRPEQFAEITVYSNADVVSAIEQGFHKICINYPLNWDDSKAIKSEVDTFIRLIFSIAEKNPDHFKATIIIDELDNYVTLHQIPPSFDNLFNRGIRFHVNAIGLAHEPSAITSIAKGACYWYIYFEQSDDAMDYWKRKKRKLGELKFENYEGYYHERNNLWLFCSNTENIGQQSSNEEQLRKEQMRESNQMDNSDNPPESEDLDSNLH